MFSLKYLIPALAVVEFAFGQDCSGTATIQNSGDASAVAACTTYSGDVVIATGAPSQLMFDGTLQEIDGTLNATMASNVTSMSFGSLQRITKDFILEGVTMLSELRMPQLSRVGSIQWNHCPALQGLDFNTGISQVDNQVNIQDTQIFNLDNINIGGALSLNIANNQRLNSLRWSLKYVNTTLIISANHRDGGLNTSFPNLETAGNVDISNVSSLEMPNLKSVDQQLSVYGSYFTGLQFPKLTKSGGALIHDNNQMSMLGMPQFSKCSGALRVFNNDALEGTINFPKVQMVGGSLNMTGSFSDLSMPQLQTVSGTSYVYSDKDISSVCSTFGNDGKLKTQGAIQGGATCSSQAKAGGAGTGGGSGTSGGSSSSSGGASYLGPAPGSAFSVLGVVLAIFGVF